MILSKHLLSLAIVMIWIVSGAFSSSCSRGSERKTIRQALAPTASTDDANVDPMESGIGESPIESPEAIPWPIAPVVGPFADPGAATPQVDRALSGQVHKFFNIHIIDKQTKENIPGATLTTVHSIPYTSDKNGFIAFYEPGLMNTKVWFSIVHPGWERLKDFLGNAGIAIDITEGGSALVELDRKSGAKVDMSHDRDTQLLLRGTVPGPSEIAGLRIVDDQSKRGVPLVLLKTASGEDYYTDNQGFIAVLDTRLINSDVSGHIGSDGYESQDIVWKATKGSISTFSIKRRNLAERLYRSTGGGSYRDSVLLGLETPVARPNVDALVAGQDTVNAVPYKNKIFWIWQDTSRFAYPLGNFGNSGAFAELPTQGNVSQDLGFNRSYFVDNDGFSRPMTPGFEPTDAPTWMGSLVTVRNAKNEEKLYGIYGKATGAADIGKVGWGVYDDVSNTFKDVKSFAKAEYVSGRVLTPKGDPLKLMHDGKEYLYYGSMRVESTEQSLVSIDAYEIYSPYQERSLNPIKDSKSRLTYTWKKYAYPAFADDLLKKNIPQKQIVDELNFRDDEGRSVKSAGASLEKNWNEFRKRFLGTIQQQGGSSLLGETWLSEADTPIGPWNFAKKIISHDKYTFYNVQQHPFFDREGGRLIYIEGTYTNFFTSEVPTPRFDYNQVIYRLDLAKPELSMPIAVYDRDESETGDLAVKGDFHRDAKPVKAVFFAMESKKADLQGYAWSAPTCNPLRRLKVSEGEPAFFFAHAPSSPQTDVLQKLYEYKSADGRHAYSVQESLSGFERNAQPLALVWRSSSDVNYPIGQYLGDLTANAGEDQCLDSVSSKATVLLDGSGSHHEKGTIGSYDWRLLAKGVVKTAKGVKASLELGKGLYFIELQVTDDRGRTSLDRSMIEIR